MKTKPLKALEPGIKKKSAINWPVIIGHILLVICGTASIYLANLNEKLEAESKEQSATIARQQLIIDTLKDNQKEADWYQARFERDQEGD